MKKGKVHLLEWIGGDPYYRCNHAVGKLSGQQIILRTKGTYKKKLTCKNCIKWKNKKNN